MSNLYWANSLIGGVPGALDAISVSDAVGDGSNIPLAADDACFVISPSLGAKLFIYTVVGYTGAVENGVDIIIPDNAPAGGMQYWKAVTFGLPSGTVVQYMGATTPAGWTKLDNSVGSVTPGSFIKVG
jgi:hypothetical protein